MDQASSLIEGIFAGVGEAIGQVTGLVDGVRDRASGASPCERFSLLEEARTNRRNQLRGWEATLAAYQLDGERAVQAAINNQGRPTSQHQDGMSLAQWMADNVLPTPPGVLLGSIFGGPIGAAGARAAWLQWIQDRLPSGRPSASTQGSLLWPGARTDIRLRNGVLRGPAVRAGYDAWLEHETLTVNPVGRPNWRERSARLQARLDSMNALLDELDAEVDQWEGLCLESNERREARVDQAILDQLANAAAARRVAVIQAYTPWVIGAVLAIGVLRR